MNKMKNKLVKLYNEAGCNAPTLNLWKQGYCHALKEMMKR